MTALQKIAMGLVIVILRAPFAGWDALADPVGWAMVLWGLGSLGVGSRLRVAAWLALAASVVVYPPMLLDRMDDPTKWWLSQPQVVFAVLLCYAVPDLVGGVRRRSFQTVATLLLLGDAGVLVSLGANVASLAGTATLLTYVGYFWLIWMLFAVSRKRDKPEVTSGPADR